MKHGWRCVRIARRRPSAWDGPDGWRISYSIYNRNPNNKWCIWRVNLGRSVYAPTLRKLIENFATARLEGRL